MKELNSYTNSRRGQFLWMSSQEKEHYLQGLKKKISEGFFYSEFILNKIVDEIAPVMAESLNED